MTARLERLRLGLAQAEENPQATYAPAIAAWASIYLEMTMLLNVCYPDLPNDAGLENCLQDWKKRFVDQLKAQAKPGQESSVRLVWMITHYLEKYHRQGMSEHLINRFRPSQHEMIRIYAGISRYNREGSDLAELIGACCEGAVYLNQILDKLA